jgi:hypothetical protein
VQTNPEPDPYDDDDDHPTLQRPAPTSMKMPVARAADATEAMVGGFVVDSTTDTDLHVVETIDPLDFADLETPKIPLDVAAVLLRASQTDDDPH